MYIYVYVYLRHKRGETLGMAFQRGRLHLLETRLRVMKHGDAGDAVAVAVTIFQLETRLIRMLLMILVNYNDLTTTEPWNHWLIREIIPQWP